MPVETLDRVNINRALAKVIAYRNCGKPAKADAWAVQLMRELQALNLVRPELVNLPAEG
jgi:hypothetical protein